MATMALGRIDTERAKPSGFLISPIADTVLLIGSPLLALVLTGLAFVAMGGSRAVAFGSPAGTLLALAVGVLSTAHVIVTFTRTHGNPAIFRRHVLRFTIIPVLVFACLALSPGARAVSIVVLVVWDVHHTGMQTFGLARLYARRAGNVSGAGRGLDLAVNHVLYAGPILASGGLLLHLQHMGPLAREWGVMSLRLEGGWFDIGRVMLVSAGLVAIAAHVVGYHRLARRGVPISPQAVALVAATGLTSIVSWGLNPFGLALVTMKIAHAVQYFALMSVAERAQVTGWFDRGACQLSLPRVAAALLLPALAFGAWTQSSLFQGHEGLGPALILSVTLLHFWYDGFTWSARIPEAL